jgi:hypothetical protein
MALFFRYGDPVRFSAQSGTEVRIRVLSSNQQEQYLSPNRVLEYQEHD